jgi:hypothetical protein
MEADPAPRSLCSIAEYWTMDKVQNTSCTKMWVYYAPVRTLWNRKMQLTIPSSLIPEKHLAKERLREK